MQQSANLAPHNLCNKVQILHPYAMQQSANIAPIYRVNILY